MSSASPSGSLVPGTVNFRDVVLEGSAMTLVAQGADLTALYRHMTAESGAVLRRCVGQIAHAAEAGVVVHCTAGKDRTGIAVALTLAALGVDRADIVRDDAATEQNLAGAWLGGRLPARARTER